MADKADARGPAKEENEFLGALYLKTAGYLRAYAGLRLFDAQAAEDVVQEAFIAAQRRVTALMGSPNPEAWLRKVVVNKVLHENRAGSRYRLLYQKIGAHLRPGHAEDRYFERDLMGRLEDKEYEVLKLVYIDGHDTSEAADILGIKYEACRKRMQKAKRKFLQEYE